MLRRGQNMESCAKQLAERLFELRGTIPSGKRHMFDCAVVTYKFGDNLSIGYRFLESRAEELRNQLVVA